MPMSWGTTYVLGGYFILRGDVLVSLAGGRSEVLTSVGRGRGDVLLIVGDWRDLDLSVVAVVLQHHQFYVDMYQGRVSYHDGNLLSVAV
jgi:hypothetical protein